MFNRLATIITTITLLLWLPLASAQHVEINSISNSSLVYLETLRITWTGGGGGPANVTVQESTGDKRMWFVAMNTRAQYADWVVNATVGTSVGLGVAQNGYSGSTLGRVIPVVASAADVTASTSGVSRSASTSAVSTGAAATPTSGAVGFGKGRQMLVGVVGACLLCVALGVL